MAKTKQDNPEEELDVVEFYHKKYTVKRKELQDKINEAKKNKWYFAYSAKEREKVTPSV